MEKPLDFITASDPGDEAQKCNGINETSAMPKKIHRKSVEQKSNPTMQKANPIIHKLVIVQKITPPKLGN